MCSYKFSQALGVSKEDYDNFYAIYAHLIHIEAEIRPDAKYALDFLAKNHNIHYVTARDEKHADITRTWLLKHNLPLIRCRLRKPDKREKRKI